MADNYIEKQQEAYEARKAAWKLAIKKGKKATTHQAKVKQTTETVTDTVTLKRRVFITGGAEGIGKSIVSMFCQKGDSVAFCDHNELAGQATAKETGATFYHVNVSDKEALEKCFLHLLAEWKDIDIVINNVGISTFTSITETSVDT